METRARWIVGRPVALGIGLVVLIIVAGDEPNNAEAATTPAGRSGGV
jgi:hypothetical protein